MHFLASWKNTDPSKMCVDKGLEFYNKDVQTLVELYSTDNDGKSCEIERYKRNY